MVRSDPTRPVPTGNSYIRTFTNEIWGALQLQFVFTKNAVLMAFRQIGQLARVIVRAPKQIKRYCQEIPVGPEGDYRHEVNAFTYGFMSMTALYILWSQKQMIDIHKPIHNHVMEKHRKTEEKLKKMSK
ncbi:hypothetical protein FXO38_15090 [Capsicum annuum]|uniref:Uncharacterized protein n=1 Tax=Capsicum annuum TaxID=4072 RepID=A0A1U8GI02_CAPAN|nr:uncharacterized protein LOC107866866 [Capsicum annuum]KAF3654523.1 hypothetical protein FXO38_15090 [Capsicum annuum]PHT84968.1 hypothetical protein T459_13411 [Capsicum annuum]